MSSDLPYWLGLTRFRKFGARRMARLHTFFPTMKDAFDASVNELGAAGIEQKIGEQFVSERLHIDPQEEQERLTQSGVRAITLTDPDYPALLKTIYDPPAVLFVRGMLPAPERPHIAIVGSRKCSNYGKSVVEAVVNALTGAHTVIVSGLAHGIDGHAHRHTLNQEGATVAVVASGLDAHLIYPSQHRQLAKQICEQGGAIISEFPLGTHPLKHHFPIRNRIIAGMCRATIVVEATEKSGSLVTAQCALEAGREVFAVPGSIFSPSSKGTHALIKEGAHPLISTEELLAPLALSSIPTAPPATSFTPTDPTQQRVWELLSHTPIHIDELVHQTNLPAQLINQALTFLELEGVVAHVGARTYKRCNP